jgi:hypothetical protein
MMMINQHHPPVEHKTAEIIPLSTPATTISKLPYLGKFFVGDIYVHAQRGIIDRG